MADHLRLMLLCAVYAAPVELIASLLRVSEIKALEVQLACCEEVLGAYRNAARANG